MIQTEKNQAVADFDWNTLENSTARKKHIPNQAILKKYGDAVYSHETYALDLYEAMFVSRDFESITDAVAGEVKRIIDVISTNEKEMIVLIEGMADCVIDLRTEKNFIYGLGFETISQFVEWIKTEHGKNNFLNNSYHLVISETKPYVKGSISKGQSQKIRNEFFEQISSPTNAYYGRIIEKNGGGFIIDVQGIRGFLPGSLAATNIVRDFDSMIGKEIPVVVEDFLKESNTFVFSYKKYVSMILPTKIDDLDTNKLYQGTVTGVAKFGVFIEFEDIFTGLLHTSKMTPECKKRFNERRFKAGDDVNFWIKEISADKKIILTDEDPNIRQMEIEDFKERNLGKITGGEVVSVQPFGTLVKLQKDICGLISQKEIKSKKKNFVIGDSVMVSVDKVQNDKIFLSLPSEV